ncbi:glycosyltransferase family 2 protein [Paracoccus tegillarcae]|uniref:Glycosyl transferase family 2 n=1 Tax=Paracoccus tegillarcae TaxID=1529068 RepID=A0A2K9EHA7_9RHOB|nr:glycosyltransferase family 2 protein [Paracoccus tegillarcae]AUH32707.1 glycosyl transferase family 2 [Paracoccus tegillarcae]
MYFKEGYGRLGRRAERQYYLLRAMRRGRRLQSLSNRTNLIRPADILVFVTLRNERTRLPYFLEYYRKLGAAHFLIVDNDSTDGSADYLRSEPDVSLWHTKESYKSARFGMDWINDLLRRYGHDHWCLTVDPDEFFIYPHHDTRPLQALTDWLDSVDDKSFSAMLLDVYPRGPVEQAVCREGQNPLEVANWFDAANYTIRKNHKYGNLWIQGGPRARAVFPGRPFESPALNKIPLVRWHWRYAYLSSTHSLLPRQLNMVYDQDGGERASGCLLHAKFLAGIAEKSTEELSRRQHYAGSQEYRAYHKRFQGKTVLWCDASSEYADWRQLADLGLMSGGNWV